MKLSGTPSLLRIAEHAALSEVTLTGSVLDIGGDKNSAYQSIFKGTYSLTTMNLDPKTSPDIVGDLEESLPLANALYDAVLLINVLEHIFNYRELLDESVRVLKPQGTLVIIVPFLFPVHPSPHDYHRFTAETLRKECEMRGLEDIVITPLGSGVFSARYLLLDRLLPSPLRLFAYFTVRYVAACLDALFILLTGVLGKRYDPAHYALGYCVTALKS